MVGDACGPLDEDVPVTVGGVGELELVLVDPVKELVLVGPVEELVLVGPVKELVLVGPVEELVLVGPVEEPVLVGPVEELALESSSGFIANPRLLASFTTS